MRTLQEIDALEETARVLLSGGVVALPTETVYGLVTLWDNEPGRARIYSLKHRPESKLLQMLAASVDDAEAVGLVRTKTLENIVARFCPGALTIVAPASDGGSIGMRIPAHSFLLSLLKRIGRPLAATSANLSGCPPALNAHDAVCELDGEPDLVVDGGVISVTGGKPSTVVSILKSEPVILREGPISLQDIMGAI